MFFSWPLEKFKTIKKSIPVFVFSISFIISEIFAVAAVCYLLSKRRNEQTIAQKSNIVLASNILREWIGRGIYDGPFPDQLKEWLNKNPNAVIKIWGSDSTPLWHSDAQMRSYVAGARDDANVKIKDVYKLIAEFNVIKNKFEKDALWVELPVQPGSNTMEFLGKIPKNDAVNRTSEDVYFKYEITLNNIPFSLVVFWASLYSLLAAFLMSQAVASVSKGVLKPLEAIKSSLGYYRRTGKKELVHYYSENELGKLVETYNNHLKYLDTSVSARISGNGELSSMEESLVSSIQAKLFEHPFPRLRGLEVALYPRKPGPGMTKFFSAAQRDEKIFIYLGHYDIINMDCALQKHRLQEQFFALVKAGVDDNEIGNILWSNMFTNLVLGPGMLYLTWDQTDNTMQVFRSGPFEIFGLMREDYQILEHGTGYFASDYTGLEVVDFTDGEGFAIVSEEILEHLNYDNQELQWKIFNRLTYNQKAGERLAGILSAISRIQPIGDDFTGLISYIGTK